MEIKRIRSAQDPLFESVWKIYTDSFPLCEQRTSTHQAVAFDSDLYYFDAYLEQGEVVGLIGSWSFPEYAYIEHLAVNSEARCGGYGSGIMRDFLDRAGKTVILEIDPVVDEISRRRLGFYGRLGFVENPEYLHPLPHYQPNDHREMNLTILTYPTAIDRQQYDTFNHDLHEVVMFGA